MPMPGAVSSQFDAPWKILLQQFLEPCLAFAFPRLHALIDWSAAPKFLDKELQRLAPEHAQGQCFVDTLVEVRLKDGPARWLLVHAEVQAQPNADFPLRMWVYHYRLWDKHQRRAMSLAVLADADPAWRPNCYHAEFIGCIEHFEFPIFKILDVADPEGEFARSGNPFALLVAAQQAALRTGQDAAARAEERFRLVRYLYGRGLEREQVRRLFRLIGWLTLLPEDLELQFDRKLATFEQKAAVMTADTLVSPLEFILLERARQEGLKRGALIGRIQNCQDLLRLPIVPMDGLAERPTESLQAELRRLEAELRARLHVSARIPSDGSPAPETGTP